jgi:hypothetical protein
MRRAAEEKQKAEDEEAAKWLSMISVEQTVRQLKYSSYFITIKALMSYHTDQGVAWVAGCSCKLTSVPKCINVACSKVKHITLVRLLPRGVVHVARQTSAGCCLHQMFLAFVTASTAAAAAAGHD